MRKRSEFARTMRAGRRAGRSLLSAHLLLQTGCDEPARVGFAVNRKVGGAVVRNKVRRRLRHLARGYLGSLPEGSLLVVRANPRAATACQADLAAELDLVIHALLRRQGGAHRP
jgi:ribonuclease P protein component